MELDNVVNSMRNQFNALDQEVQQQRAIQEQKNRRFNVDMAQYQRALDADTTSGIDEFNNGENLINKLVTSGLQGTALDDVISKTPELAKLYPDALSRMALIDTINKRREHMGTTGNANPNNYRVDYTENEDNNWFLRQGASAVKGFEGVFRNIGSSAYYGSKERGLRDEIAKTPKEVIDLNKKLEFNENLDGRIRALTDSIGISDGIDISEKQNQLNILNQLKEKYALTPEEENLMGSEAYNRDTENKYQLAKTTLAKQKFTGGTFLSNLSDEFVNDMDNYDNYLNNVDDEYLKQIYRDLGENPELFDNWGYTWDSMKNMFSQNLGSTTKFFDFAGSMVPWALLSFGTGGAGALAKAGYSATMLGSDAFGRYQEFVNAQYEKDPYNAPQELRAMSMAVASTVADFMGAKLTLEPAGKKLLRMAIFGKLQTPLREAERIAMETGLNGVKGNGNILHSLARQRAMASGNDELAELATRNLNNSINKAKRANQSLLGKTPGVLLDGAINTARAIGKGASTIADKSGLSLTQALKAGVNLGTENVLSNTASQYGRGTDLANLDKESILESAVIGLAGGAMFNPLSSAVQTAKAKYVNPIFKKYERFAAYTDKQQNGILADLDSGKIKDPMAIQALTDTAEGSIEGINTLLKEQGNKVVEKVNSKNKDAKLSMSEEGRIEVSGTVAEADMAKINAFNSEVDKTQEIKKKHQDILNKLAETETIRSGEILKNNNEQEKSIFESNELQNTYSKSSEENKREYVAHVTGLDNTEENKEAINKAKETIDKVTTSENSQEVDKAIDSLGLNKDTVETLDKMKINKITVAGLVTKNKEVENTLNDKTQDYDAFKDSVKNSNLTKKEQSNLLKAIDVDSFNASRKTKEGIIQKAIEEELTNNYGQYTPEEQNAIGTLLSNSNATKDDVKHLADSLSTDPNGVLDASKSQELVSKISESKDSIETKKKDISDEFDAIGVAKSFDSEEQAKKALNDLEEGTQSGLKKFNPFSSNQALKGRYKVVESKHVNKGKYYLVDNGSVKEAEDIKGEIDSAIKAKDHAKIKEKISNLADKYKELGVSESYIKTLKRQAEFKGDFTDEHLTAIKNGLTNIENGLKEEKEEYVRKLSNSGVINRYNKLSKSKELANNRGREKLYKAIREKIKNQRNALAKLFPILKGLVDNPHNANAIKNVLKSLGEINIEISGKTKPLYEALTDINTAVSKLQSGFSLTALDSAIQGLKIKLPKDFVALCNTAVSAINSVGNVTEEIASFRNTFMVLGRVAEQSSTTNSNTSELASTEGNTFNSTKENNAILSSFAELKNTVIASGVLDIQQYRSNTVNSVIEALGVRISNASTSIQDTVDNWVSATVTKAYNDLGDAAVKVETKNLYNLLDLTYEKSGIRRVIDDIADEIENSSGSILNKQLANAIRNIQSEAELIEFLKTDTNKATLLQAVVKSKTMLKIASYYSKQDANNITHNLANIDTDKFSKDFYKADTSTPLTVGVTQEKVYESLETFFKHIFPGKSNYESYMAIMMGNNKGGSDGIPDTMVSAFISALGYKELIDYGKNILSSLNNNGKLNVLNVPFKNISRVLSNYNGKVPTYTDLTNALQAADSTITPEMVKLVAGNFGALSFCIQLKSLLPNLSNSSTITDIIIEISTSSFKNQSNNLDALYSNRNTKVYEYDTHTTDEGKETYTLDDVNKRLDILRSSDPTVIALIKSDIENSDLSETVKDLLLEKLDNKTNTYTDLDQDILNKIGSFYTSFINKHSVDNDTTTTTTTTTATPNTYSGTDNILNKYVTAKNKKFINSKRINGLSGNSIQTIKLQNKDEDLDNILDEIIKITNGLYDFTGKPAILVDLFGKNPIDGKFRLPPELASAIATTAYVYLDRLSSESSEDFLTKINTQFPGLGSVFADKNLMDRASITQTLGMAIYQQFFKGKMPDGMKNTLIAELGTYTLIALEDLGAVKIQKLDTKTRELKGTNYSGKNPLLNVVSIQETKLNNLREKKEKLDYSGNKGKQNHLADLLDTDFVKPTVVTTTEYTAQQTELENEFTAITSTKNSYNYDGEATNTNVGFTTQYSDDGEICKVTINNPDGNTKNLVVYLSGDQVTSIDGTRVSPYKLFSIATNVGLGYPVEVSEMKNVYNYLFGTTSLPTASQIANIFNDGYEYWTNNKELKNRLLEYVGYEEPKVTGTTLDNERTKYINLIKQLVIDMGYVNSMSTNSASGTEVIHLRYSSTINNRGIVLSDLLNMRENKLNRPFLDLYKNGNTELDIADDSFEVTDDSRLLMKASILLNTVDDGVDKKTRDEINTTYKEFLEVAKSAYTQYMSVSDFITEFNNKLPTETKLSKLKYTPATYRAIKYLLDASDSSTYFTTFHNVDEILDQDRISNWRIPLEIDGLTNGQGIKAMMGITLSSTSSKSLNQLLAVGVSTDRTYFREIPGSNDTYQLNGVFVKREILHESLERFLDTGIDNQEALSALATCFGLDSNTSFGELVDAVFSRSFMKAPTMVTGYGSGKKALIVRITEEFQKKISELFYEASKGDVSKLTSWFNSMNALNNGNGVTISFDGRSATFKSIDALLKAYPASNGLWLKADFLFSENSFLSNRFTSSTIEPMFNGIKTALEETSTLDSSLSETSEILGTTISNMINDKVNEYINKGGDYSQAELVVIISNEIDAILDVFPSTLVINGLGDELNLIKKDIKNGVLSLCDNILVKANSTLKGKKRSSDGASGYIAYKGGISNYTGIASATVPEITHAFDSQIIHLAQNALFAQKSLFLGVHDAGELTPRAGLEFGKAINKAYWQSTIRSYDVVKGTISMLTNLESQILAKGGNTKTLGDIRKAIDTNNKLLIKLYSDKLAYLKSDKKLNVNQYSSWDISNYDPKEADKEAEIGRINKNLGTIYANEDINGFITYIKLFQPGLDNFYKTGDNRFDKAFKPAILDLLNKSKDVDSFLDYMVSNNFIDRNKANTLKKDFVDYKEKLMSNNVPANLLLEITKGTNENNKDALKNLSQKANSSKSELLTALKSTLLGLYGKDSDDYYKLVSNANNVIIDRITQAIINSSNTLPSDSQAFTLSILQECVSGSTLEQRTVFARLFNRQLSNLNMEDISFDVDSTSSGRIVVGDLFPEVDYRALENQFKQEASTSYFLDETNTNKPIDNYTSKLDKFIKKAYGDLTDKDQVVFDLNNKQQLLALARIQALQNTGLLKKFKVVVIPAISDSPTMRSLKDISTGIAGALKIKYPNKVQIRTSLSPTKSNNKGFVSMVVGTAFNDAFVSNDIHTPNESIRTPTNTKTTEKEQDTSLVKYSTFADKENKVFKLDEFGYDRGDVGTTDYKSYNQLDLRTSPLGRNNNFTFYTPTATGTYNNLNFESTDAPDVNKFTDNTEALLNDGYFVVPTNSSGEVLVRGFETLARNNKELTEVMSIYRNAVKVREENLRTNKSTIEEYEAPIIVETKPDRLGNTRKFIFQVTVSNTVDAKGFSGLLTTMQSTGVSTSHTIINATNPFAQKYLDESKFNDSSYLAKVRVFFNKNKSAIESISGAAKYITIPTELLKPELREEGAKSLESADINEEQISELLDSGNVCILTNATESALANVTSTTARGDSYTTRKTLHSSHSIHKINYLTFNNFDATHAKSVTESWARKTRNLLGTQLNKLGNRVLNKYNSLSPTQANEYRRMTKHSLMDSINQAKALDAMNGEDNSHSDWLDTYLEKTNMIVNLGSMESMVPGGSEELIWNAKEKAVYVTHSVSKNASNNTTVLKHELVHGIWESSTNDATAVHQATQLFQYVAKNITVDDLIAIGCSEARAKEMLNYIFGSDSTVNHLAEFMAYIATEKDFQLAIQNLQQRNNLKTDITTRTRGIISRAWSKLFGLKAEYTTKSEVPKDIVKASRKIFERVFDASQKMWEDSTSISRGDLSKNQTDELGGDYLSGLMSEVLGVNQTNRVLSKMLDGSAEDPIVGVTSFIRKHISKAKTDFADQLATSLEGVSKKSWDYIKLRLKCKQEVDAARQMASNSISNKIEDIISGLPTKVVNQLPTQFIKLDISCLSKYDDNYVNLLTDKETRNKAIAELENTLRSNQFGNFYVNASKGLANYLITGHNNSGIGYRNAYEITSMCGSQYTHYLSHTDPLISSIDALTTLYGINILESTQKLVYKQIEPTVIKELVDIHNNIKDFEFSNVYKNSNQKLHIPKGQYSGGNSYGEYKVYLSDSKEAIKWSLPSSMNETKLDPLGAKIANGKQYLTVHHNFRLPVSREAGIFALTDVFNGRLGKGTRISSDTTDEANLDPQQLTEISSYLTNTIKRLNTTKPALMGETDGITIPTFGITGKLSGARFELNPEVTRVKTHTSTKFSNIMGDLYGSAVERIASPETNAKLGQAVLDLYEANKTKKDKKYVWVNEESTDEDIREYYKMIPYEVKDLFEKKYPSKGVPIEQDALNLVLPRKATTSKVIDHDYYKAVEEGVATINQRLCHIFRNGGINKLEDVANILTRVGKENLVIKGISVSMGNLISNNLLLSKHGMSPVKCIKDQIEGMHQIFELNNYLRKLQELKLKELAHTATRDDMKEINAINNSIKALPIYPLYEYGALGTIADDLGNSDAFIKDTISKYAPTILQDALHNLAVDQKSVTYNILREFATLPDKAGKYALYKNLSKNLTTDERIRICVGEFIDYGIPLPKGMDYVEAIGISNFLKYPMGIQSVIHRLSVDNAKSAIPWLISQGSLGVNLPDTYDSLLGLNTMSRGLSVPGLGIYFDSVKQLFSYKVANSLFGN